MRGAAEVRRSRRGPFSFKTKFKIADVNTKVFKRNPLAPFTTSTLQQTASGRFGFGASRTMQIAQRLYQGVDIEGETTGLITYMRTDGTNISKEAIDDFRKLITLRSILFFCAGISYTMKSVDLFCC